MLGIVIDDTSAAAAAALQASLYSSKIVLTCASVTGDVLAIRNTSATIPGGYALASSYRAVREMLRSAILIRSPNFPVWEISENANTLR
jgi:hypothetical protein